MGLCRLRAIYPRVFCPADTLAIDYMPRNRNDDNQSMKLNHLVKVDGRPVPCPNAGDERDISSRN
jgi:hypothetical protein